MTLDGTNTYVLGHPGRGSALVVDPSPDDDSHLANVERALADLDTAWRWSRPQATVPITSL